MGKNIILCFDGTCNDPKDSLQNVRLGKVEDDNISNVLKLHLLFGGTLRQKIDVSSQMSFYYSGVGTYGNLFARLRNIVRSPENEDVGTIIRRAIKDLYTYHQPGDLLFVFGFSRGAAIARRFVSVLRDTFPALGKEPPEVRFLGVFDTVAAMNRPNLMKEEIKPASDVVFENQTISPLINEALHLLSLDERRIAFMPTLMNRDPARVTEVWFPGAHSDVGGGFYYDGLADMALQFMLDECARRALPLKVLTPGQINYHDLFDNEQDNIIDYKDVIIQPNYLGTSHQQHAVTMIKEAFLDVRTPRVNVNDKQSIYPPLLHHSVFDRMADDPDYDPEALRNRMVNSYTGQTVGFRVWYGPGREVEYRNLLDAKLAAMHQPVELKAGESRQFIVYANQKFSSSRVLVRKGERYRFVVDLSQVWFDGSLTATPSGWTEESKNDLEWYEKVFIGTVEDERRYPEAQWFEVIGAVNKSEQDLVRITQFIDSPWQAGESGEFYAFPNDLLSKYGNNLGSIQVTIHKEG